MGDNYPNWKATYLQDFHAIVGRQLKSCIDLLPVDSTIREFNSNETTPPVMTRAGVPAVDSKGLTPVYGNTSSDLFNLFSATMAAPAPAGIQNRDGTK